MRAGYADVDVTPKVGTQLNGFAARVAPSNGVDLPLKARAVWLEGSGVRALWITLDALGLADATSELWMERLGRELGIPAGNIVLHCSHTHAGPMTVPLRGVGSADEEYLGMLYESVLAAARRAMTLAEPIRVQWGQAPVRLGVNRRERIPGRGTVLGRNPDGPCDDRVRVIRLVGDKLSLCIFNHACHPYCLGPEHLLISPDFCGHAVVALEELGHRAVYLNGCAGDIAPLRAFEGQAAAAEEGRRLAQAVHTAVQDADEPLDAPNLSIRSQRLSLPYQPLPPIDLLRRQLDESDRTVRDEDRANPLVRQRIRTAWNEWLDGLSRVSNGKPLPPLPTRVSLLSLGDLSIAALPGEIFYETGAHLAQRLGTQSTIVAGYCHGFIGYVPPAHAYDEGGYEPDESYRFIGLWKLAKDASANLCDAVEALAATNLAVQGDAA